MKPGPYINSIIIIWPCSQETNRLIREMDPKGQANNYNNQ